MLEKNYKKKEPKTNGLRKEFIDLFEKEDMSVDEAIKQFVLNHKVYKEEDLIRWLKEELENGKISKQGLIKIKVYLDRLKEKEQTSNTEDKEI